MQQTATLLRPSITTRWRSSTVELLICNQGVVGSIPIASFTSKNVDARRASGEVPEWPKGADCKSAGVSLRRFESSPLHRDMLAGIAQLARASAFQAEGRGFESRFPLRRRPISAHLLRCSVARLCGVQLNAASGCAPCSLPRALQLDASRPPAAVRNNGADEEINGARRASRVLLPICGGASRRHPLGSHLSPHLKKEFASFAQVAQSAEHVLGKDEVGGSIPLLGFGKDARPASRARSFIGGSLNG